MLSLENIFSMRFHCFNAEKCLLITSILPRTAVWRWSEGGSSRALARRSFANQVFSPPRNVPRHKEQKWKLRSRAIFLIHSFICLLYAISLSHSSASIHKKSKEWKEGKVWSLKWFRSFFFFSCLLHSFVLVEDGRWIFRGCMQIPGSLLNDGESFTERCLLSLTLNSSLSFFM